DEWSNSISKHPSHQRRYRSFHAQDSRAKMHRLKSRALERRDLRGNEAALRADSQCHLPLHVTRARSRCRGMCNERERPCGNRWQLVLDERAEEPPQLDSRHHCVARLFQAEDGLLAEVLLG